MGNEKYSLRNIVKSKFVRSIFLQTGAIFLGVIIIIITTVFFSFTSEINKNIIQDRQKQLDVIEQSITQRMDEVLSMAFNISMDDTFYINPVSKDQRSGYEMTQTLDRYLVGNRFVQYLGFYRISEPKLIYTSCGEMLFNSFWNTYLSFDGYTADDYLEQITTTRRSRILPALYDKNHNLVLTYISTLPQFSANPQAFIIMLIPLSEIEPLLRSQIGSYSGKVAIIDSSGKEVYAVSTLQEDMHIDPSMLATKPEISINGKKYVVQTKVSSNSNWTYVSVIRLNDLISDTANQQLVFILLLSAIMLVAIVLMFVCITVQYNPINRLAMSVTDKKDQKTHEIIDEKNLLLTTLTALKIDSEQKNRFETAYYEATAASNAKSAFLSNISHDIRTPMNAIIGMTELAISNQNDSMYMKDCLQKIRTASRYLLDIINNVLDMSRIESGRFTLSEKEMDLSELIYGLILITQHTVDDKKQHLIVEIENVENEKIIADSVRLSQVFMNILSNSIKFTPSGGTIGLHITQKKFDKPNCAKYVFTFFDTGLGMSQDFVSHVFETFSRERKSDDFQVEGTGLGMAIAKNLVEMMGGTITCESELEKGTTFTVTIPIQLSAIEHTEPLPMAETKRVLIFGTDDQIIQSQVRSFTSFGVHSDYALSLYEVSVLSNQADEKNEPYDFVIINPPKNDASGIDSVLSIRSILKNNHTTYILSAYDVININQPEAKKAGITFFVRQPFFKSTIRNIFEQKKSNGALQEIKETEIINLTGRRILLAEDNKMNTELASTIISATGAEIVTVVTGKQAVDEYCKNPAGYFDLILMDLQMPVMNGYEATAAIRSLKKDDSKTIFIYAMTANTFDDDVRQVRDAGMNGHLGKPYMPKDLYQILSIIK